MDAAYLKRLISNEENQLRLAHPKKWVEPRAMPILLSGGVGDVIMSIPLVEMLWKNFGPIEIFTRHHETFNYFKPKYLPTAYLDNEVQDLTWLLVANAVVNIVRRDSFSGFRHEGAERLWKSQRDYFDRNPEMEVLVSYHPLKDWSLAKYARRIGIDRRECAFESLGLSPIAGLELLPMAKREKYITVHDGYELASETMGRSTKTWNLDSWVSLVKRFRDAHPDYRVIQLGGKTSRPIEGVDQCLVNQIPLLESFEILSHSALHVDGDSGLVHAATAMQVPCVVMFGPTPDYFYGYPRNTNIRSASCESACYWLRKDWLSRCPIGLPGPMCMDEISVDEVYQAIVNTRATV